MTWLDWLRRLTRRVPAPGAPPKPSPPPLPPAPPGGSGVLMRLHNEERSRAGLPPLGEDPRADAAAARCAGAMARLGVMSHTPDGTTAGARLAQAGYAWSRCGENVAAGQRSEGDVVDAWISSPGHRQNILGPYQAAGFARSESGGGTLYWCAVFASPRGLAAGSVGLIIVPGFADATVWEPPGLDERPSQRM